MDFLTKVVVVQQCVVWVDGHQLHSCGRCLRAAQFNTFHCHGDLVAVLRGGQQWWGGGGVVCDDMGLINTDVELFAMQPEEACQPTELPQVFPQLWGQRLVQTVERYPAT